MKMKATIEVEFETDAEQGQSLIFMLEAALRRGVKQLKSSIESGTASTSASTGIKRGSAKTSVIKTKFE
jgi:hypothetical protein